MRTTYELCEDTEECQLNLFCWYAYKDEVTKELREGEKLKKCLPMFSQFPTATFGWRRWKYKNEANNKKLEEELTNLILDPENKYGPEGW